MKKKVLEEIIGKRLNIANLGSIVMDTRLLKKGDTFLAIRGGNNHIEEALEKKPSLVICENTKFSNRDDIIVVNNTITFMQKWAKKYLEKLDILTIGITGSNGKTSTKDIIYTLLSSFDKGIKTIGNYNNHIGLPFTVLQLEADDKFAVLEMGMSNFGEIDLLGEIVKPTVSCITNIGDSHLENVGDRDGVFKAKTELLRHTQKLKIINGDDEYLKNVDGIKIGFDRANNYSIGEVTVGDDETKFVINGKYDVVTNLQGEHNMLNITMAIGLLDELGYSIEKTLPLLKSLNLTQMRFEKIKKENRLFINDAYNASPVSVKYALDTLKGIYKEVDRYVVLADMLELGEKSEALHRDVVDYIRENPFKKVYLYGEEFKAISKEIEVSSNIRYYENKDEIKSELKSIKEESVILLKGSRGMRLEDLID